VSKCLVQRVVDLFWNMLALSRTTALLVAGWRKHPPLRYNHLLQLSPLLQRVNQGMQVSQVHTCSGSP
jgi:hypothetical protein